MLNDRWSLLNDIQERLKSPSDIPPELMFAIAERLEEAISASSNTPLKILRGQLIELLDRLLHTALPETIDAVRGSGSANVAASEAYVLGQVSFAQLLAAQVAERRVDDHFVDTLRGRRFEKYLRALVDSDRTGVELAEITEECAETVSRKLKSLRELGVTDFRRDGTSLFNFLTPTARAVISESKAFPDEDMAHIEKERELTLIRSTLPPHMQKPMTLSPQRSMDLETAL